MTTDRFGMTKSDITTTLLNRNINEGGNVDLIDQYAAMYLQDVIANIPAAGTEGRYFWATDENKLYYDDGAAWNDLAKVPTPATQGSILYVNGTPDYALLSPGTAYYPLVSGGAGADPNYASLSAILDNLLSSTRGVLPKRGSSAWDGLSLGDRGQVVGSDGTDPVYFDMSDGFYRNCIINGSFLINQRQYWDGAFDSAHNPANDDDTYLVDRWILLSDGDDIVDVSQTWSVLPTGGCCALKLEVETAGKKFGMCQILEKLDAVKLAGKTVSLQFKARTTTGAVIENIRAVVLAWDGTADTVTSDVVSAWNAEGSNPTWATNWTAENTPANLAVTADAYGTHQIEGISIDTPGMTNLAVFIWVDDTDAAVDDVLYITDVQLNEGSVCLPYAPVIVTEEVNRCLRYLQVTGGGHEYQRHAAGLALSTTDVYLQVNHYIPMRTAPTLYYTGSGMSKLCVMGAGGAAKSPNLVELEGSSNGKMSLLHVTTGSADFVAMEASELLSYNEVNQLRYDAEL